MNAKKLLALLLAVAMVLSMAACGAEKPEPPHEHEYVYTESGEGHVGTCACNASTEVLPHTYGADDKCTACGAEKPSVTPPATDDDEGDFSGRY